MSDLELTKLCAQAMGYTHSEENGESLTLRPTYQQMKAGLHTVKKYRPLINDAQAMALVKRFRVGINAWNPDYYAWIQSREITSEHSASTCTWNADLNRAIVECVAKMQKAKG